MHYIRFLKTPKIHVESGSVTVKAVVTVTTDLGETFYPSDLDLVATIRDAGEDGEIYLRRRLQWTGGARSMPITFDVSRQDIEWPACMHVAVRNAPLKPSGFLPPIVDVWSGTLNPTKGHFDSGRRVERRFTSLAERTLSLLEDAGDSIARHLWDGSQALAQYIDQTISLQTQASPLPLLEYVLVSATYRRLNAIELGCGCGSVGISVAQSIPDCDVMLTDLAEVTELVEANISRMKPAVSSRVRFQPLDWEQPLPENLQNRKNDLIIVSECTYNTDTLQALVATLSSLVVRSPKAVIVVSTKTRHESEKGFFALMKNAGFIEEGILRLPLPGEPGNGYADSAPDVGLHVFHGRDHRLSLSPRERSEEEVPKAEVAKKRTWCLHGQTHPDPRNSISKRFTRRSFTLSPNALRILDKLGIYRQIDQGYRLEKTIYRDDKGAWLGEYFWGSEKRYGYKALRIERAHVLRVLEKEVKAYGVEIRYEHALREVISESTEGAVFKVLVGKGTSEAVQMIADMLVGCDGVHSRTRKWLCDADPVFRGTVGITASMQRRDLRFGDWEDEKLQNALSVSTPFGVVLMLPQDPEGQNIQVARQFAMADRTKGEWQVIEQNKDWLEELMRSDLDQMPQLLCSAISHIRKSETYIWPYRSLPRIDQWISPGGRVIVIGDAAHTIIPAAGQGACQSIVDAWTLAEVLTKESSLRTWQMERQVTVDRVVKLSMQLANMQLPLEVQAKLPEDEKVSMVGTEEERVERMAWLFAAD